MTLIDPGNPSDGIDWNQVWMEQKRRHLGVRNYQGSDEFWSNPRNIQRVYQRFPSRSLRVKKQIEGIEIQKGCKVLDIGAGPGTLAIPLAKMGCHVTVVEPSAAMREVMMRCQEREKVQDMQVLAMHWEDVNPGDLEEYDLVIASFSLSMIDIGAAIDKMNRACRGSVYLYWFLTPPVWADVLFTLWPRIQGVPFYFEPTADVLYQVLLQKKIYANFHPEKNIQSHIYQTLGDAVDDYAARMNCTDEGQRKIIRDYLRRKMAYGETGFSIRGESWNAKICWKN
jgi:SAM-dependent methyltransferase